MKYRNQMCRDRLELCNWCTKATSYGYDFKFVERRFCRCQLPEIIIELMNRFRTAFRRGDGVSWNVPLNSSWKPIIIPTLEHCSIPRKLFSFATIPARTMQLCWGLWPLFIDVFMNFKILTFQMFNYAYYFNSQVSTSIIIEWIVPVCK